jgi:DNA-directed RNA polymerase specialized sigma24 family protein
MDYETLKSLSGRQRFTALYELCLAGTSLSEIGKGLGISKQAVSSYVHKYASCAELQLLRDKWDSKKLDHNKIASLLQTKEMTHRQIAELCGCSEVTVKRVKSRTHKNCVKS